MRVRQSASASTGLVEDWSWQRSANCRGEVSSLFFCGDGEVRSQRREREKRAKSLCADCPVLAQCREHSLRAPERYGIWGGMTEDERYEALGMKRDRNGHLL
jgi:WhiB family transcriptional regulator, redox-sensing transcriptional regulator